MKFNYDGGTWNVPNLNPVKARGVISQGLFRRLNKKSSVK